MCNVLFLVTGMTPQIITETVWALVCDPDNDNPWVPDEIHVLSTDDGLNQIRSRLFSEKEGFKFAKFQEEYPQLASITFDGSDNYLHVIKDHDGNILKDLKTPDDNELAANLICQMVREFTERDEVALHVSIAGGRKTMGFYAGYALSLYGRAQDKMSHVLVDERYELARDFFYPSVSDDVFVTNRDGIELRTKDAQIWLANIPFVRLRSSLNHDGMIANKTFSEVIETLNLSLKPIQIVLNIKDRQIIISDKICQLTPKEFGIYFLCVQLLQKGEVLHYPSKEFDDDIGDKHQKQFNQIYGQYRSKDDVTVDNSYLSTALSTMKKKLINEFGVDIYDKICIQQKDAGYGIMLLPEQIVIK